MNTYTYTVTLEVEVDAYDESDAWEAVDDAFGVGDQMGVRVTNCEWKEKRAGRKR
jgi:hypothetical protein